MDIRWWSICQRGQAGYPGGAACWRTSTWAATGEDLHGAGGKCEAGGGVGFQLSCSRGFISVDSGETVPHPGVIMLFVKLKAKFTGWHARYAWWWMHKPWLHDQIRWILLCGNIFWVDISFLLCHEVLVFPVSARCAPWDMMVGSPCHPPSADPFRCPLPATNPPWRPLRRRAPWGAAPSCQPTHRPGSRPVVWAACMARNDLRDWEMSTNRIQKISKTQRPLT